MIHVKAVTSRLCVCMGGGGGDGVRMGKFGAPGEALWSFHKTLTACKTIAASTCKYQPCRRPLCVSKFCPSVEPQTFRPTVLVWRDHLETGYSKAPPTKENGNNSESWEIISCISHSSLPLGMVTPSPPPSGVTHDLTDVTGGDPCPLLNHCPLLEVFPSPRRPLNRTLKRAGVSGNDGYLSEWSQCTLPWFHDSNCVRMGFEHAWVHVCSNEGFREHYELTFFPQKPATEREVGLCNYFSKDVTGRICTCSCDARERPRLTG